MTTLAIKSAINTSDQLGETPLWCDRTQKLWWLDIERPKLQSLDPLTDAYQAFPFDCVFAGSLALCATGGLLIALDNNLHRFTPETGELKLFAEVEPATPKTRLNDGRTDRQGRFWVGTVDNNFKEPLGSLYRIDPSGKVTRFMEGIICSNTLAFSPDGRTMYFSDTRGYVTWAFDLDIKNGDVSNRRIFADYRADNSRPDGACVDAEGFLWNAIFGGHRIIRYAPDGRIDRVIELPVSNPTCLCFGGRDFATLYVTTATKMIAPDVLAKETHAGAVLALDVGIRGIAESRFDI
jgi:sugar lactone lactonase YvrE